MKTEEMKKKRGEKEKVKNLGSEKKKMKNKTKIVAIAEIAIVVCSVLLVALPAIAAEQNQEMQKVSASEVTTASEDDYVLGIYGNANEDDTIDMRDLTYVKLIFFGKKHETELADAKYDGKINPLDFIQIKLIIVGKEKELTIVQYLGYSPDITEEPVTVPMPIKTIVALGGTYCPEALCAFGVHDKIVGVGEGVVKSRPELKTFLEDKPSVGNYKNPDMEKIMELKPDIVITYAYKCWPVVDNPLKAAGIPVVHMDFHHPEKHSRAIRTAGYILDKQERAEGLISFEQQHLNRIKERVENLKPEQKTRVYFEFKDTYSAAAGGGSFNAVIIACGGINIFADLPGTASQVDPEAVIVRNPQVIIRNANRVPAGYGVTDTSQMEELRNDIMSRPGWDHIDAVKNGRVYIIHYPSTKSTHMSVFNSYIAKWLHPELFDDIDPVDIHREWIETFLGIEYKGVYAYPIPS